MVVHSPLQALPRHSLKEENTHTHSPFLRFFYPSIRSFVVVSVSFSMALYAPLHSFFFRCFFFFSRLFFTHFFFFIQSACALVLFSGARDAPSSMTRLAAKKRTQGVVLPSFFWRVACLIYRLPLFMRFISSQKKTKQTKQKDGRRNVVQQLKLQLCKRVNYHSEEFQI